MKKIYIYEVCFKKIGSLFCKVIVVYKNKNKVIIEDLKLKKIKRKKKE